MKMLKLVGLAVAAYFIGRLAHKYGLPLVAKVPVVGPMIANFLA